MAESLCQKRALEAFGLDPANWGGEQLTTLFQALIKKLYNKYSALLPFWMFDKLEIFKR